MSVVKVAPKFHVGKNPVHLAIFKRDEQAVYSLIYRDGKQGRVYAKRFRVGGITRDKEYPLTQESAGTKVLFFARHETEEESNAQLLKIKLKHELRMRVDAFEYKFGELAIKGRDSKGNMLTEKVVEKITRVRGGGAVEEEEE
jgi:topoisomerase-4 subunit A